MDFFGIEAGVRAALGMYFAASRATDRSTTLLSSLKDGDRVIFASEQERRRFAGMARDRELKIDCVVIDPKAYVDEAIHRLGTSRGRTIFDHSWIEIYYIDALRSASQDIDRFQERLSGWGEAHERTRLQAREIARFHKFFPAE